MARRKKQSALEDLIDVAALLPWWAGLLCALICYIILHQIANMPVQQATDPSQFVGVLSGQLYKMFASLGQVILPFCFILGAGISAFTQKKRRNLFDSVRKIQFPQAPKIDTSASKADPIKRMTWQEFELLISEFFRQQGYSVKETGAGGPDGGVDLRLSLNGQKFIVQCKHWKAFKVGVKIIREQFGIMNAEVADGAFIVTSGLFTEEAIEFADDKNIILIDGIKLKKIIADLKQTPTRNVFENMAANQVKQSVPHCPTCASLMVKRTARKGVSAGKQFWGCSRFPKCKGTISISER